ncbi:MAG: type II secretion system F family protein, partial [Candidatus Methanomethylicaceae archaeon]
MPIYKYTAIKSDGKRVKGEEECYSIDDLERILEERELILLGFTEIERRSRKTTWTVRKKISDDEMIAFLQTLGSLLDTGVDLIQSLKTTLRFSSKRMSIVLSEVIRTVESGSPLSQALKITGYFPPSVVEPIATGEETGRLAEVVMILAERIKNAKRVRERIKKASMYPTFVMVFVGMLIIVVFKFALPKVVSSIKEVLAGREYPPVTKRVIALAEFTTTWFPWIAGFGITLAVAIYIGRRNPKIKRIFDAIKLKIPHLRDIVLFSDIIKAIQTLLISVQTGLTYVRALELARSDISNEIIKEKFDAIRSMVAAGGTLSDAFQQQSIDPYLTTIISAGEYTGRLEEMLGKAGEHYMEYLNDKIDKFFAWLEPIIILILGIVVAFV